MRRAPVRTNHPLAVELINELLGEVYALELEPPLESGHVLIRDFRGTGVDVVLSTSLT
jgi:CxxC motif-containing protein